MDKFVSTFNFLVSCNTNIQSDKTDELSHQILINITPFGNTKGKILSQFSLRQLARHVEPSKNIYRGWSGSKRLANAYNALSCILYVAMIYFVFAFTIWLKEPMA